jgi:hypothetical protein
MRKLCQLILTSLVAAGFISVARAEDLVISFPDPAIAVTVPGLPQINFAPHPAAGQNPSARLLGSTPDGINVSLLTPKAEGASAQQCASWLTGSTISRYSPDLSSVQLVPAGANAWVLIYPFKVAQVEQLKAHIFSGNGKGQCLEVHISRIGASEQQRRDWFTGFRGVKVVAE